MELRNRATRVVYGKVLPQLVRARIRNDGRPVIIAHHITNRCMCKCASCLWRNNDWEDVPTAEVERFYRQARQLGFVALAVTGGEPFLRRDLGRLMYCAKRELGMGVMVFTTGWFLDRRMDEVLPSVDLLIVSVDSAQAERHDQIRGLDGLFDRMVAGVEQVRRRYPRVSVHLNCCLQQGTPAEIDALIALADDLGVRISFDVITELRHGEGESFTETDVGLSPTELVHTCAGLRDRKRGGSPIINSARYFDYFAQGSCGYRCHMPKMMMYVDGRGNIEDCLDLDHPIANYREMPLAEIMELPRFRQLRVDAEGCSSCNSPTMVDLSFLWEKPWSLARRGGISLG